MQQHGFRVEDGRQRPQSRGIPLVVVVDDHLDPVGPGDGGSGSQFLGELLGIPIPVRRHGGNPAAGERIEPPGDGLDALVRFERHQVQMLDGDGKALAAPVHEKVVRRTLGRLDPQPEAAQASLDRDHRRLPERRSAQRRQPRLSVAVVKLAAETGHVDAVLRVQVRERCLNAMHASSRTRSRGAKQQGARPRFHPSRKGQDFLGKDLLAVAQPGPGHPHTALDVLRRPCRRGVRPMHRRVFGHDVDLRVQGGGSPRTVQSVGGLRHVGKVPQPGRDARLVGHGCIGMHLAGFQVGHRHDQAVAKGRGQSRGADRDRTGPRIDLQIRCGGGATDPQRANGNRGDHWQHAASEFR